MSHSTVEVISLVGRQPTPSFSSQELQDIMLDDFKSWEFEEDEPLLPGWLDTLLLDILFKLQKIQVIRSVCRTS